MPEIQSCEVDRVHLVVFNQDGSRLGDMAAISAAIKFAEDFYGGGEWVTSKTKPPYAHNIAAVEVWLVRKD